MFTNSSRGFRIRRIASTAAVAALLTLGVVGCSQGDPGEGETLKVALVGVDLTNPYFLKMADEAEAAAAELGVDLSVQTLAAGSGEDIAIQQIESAVALGVSAIMVAPGSAGLAPAIERARDQGVVVVAVDNPVEPAGTTDMAFITGNRAAGKSLGNWVAAKLDGETAVIALLDVFAGQVFPVDVDRDQGFLEGMGIDLADPNLNGDEAPEGEYSNGDYVIACNQATLASQDGGRTAMENCLSANPDINVVYTINEPAAFGAHQALEAAGAADGVIVATFDGSCAGIDAMARGEITVDAQTYPGQIVRAALAQIVANLRDGAPFEASEGVDYFDAGSALVTDEPVDGVASISSDEAKALCF